MLLPIPPAHHTYISRQVLAPVLLPFCLTSYIPKNERPMCRQWERSGAFTSLTDSKKCAQLISKIPRGGLLGKCPNMCFFCTQRPAIHCPSIRLGPFLTLKLAFLTLKLALWVTRGCAWVHVGHSVCKLARLQAHNDYQNPNRVVLHGKTACVGLHPQLLIVSLHYFCDDICLLQISSTPPEIMWFGMVGGLLWRFCGEKWGSRCGQLDVCAATG